MITYLLAQAAVAIFDWLGSIMPDVNFPDLASVVSWARGLLSQMSGVTGWIPFAPVMLLLAGQLTIWLGFAVVGVFRRIWSYVPQVGGNG